MTLAELIVNRLLERLGYREPTAHSNYQELVDEAQTSIEENLDAIANVLGEDIAHKILRTRK